MAEQSKSDPLVIEGLQGIKKNLEHLLESEQVREIEAIGTPFDPNIHDSISFLIVMICQKVQSPRK